MASHAAVRPTQGEQWPRCGLVAPARIRTLRIGLRPSGSRECSCLSEGMLPREQRHPRGELNAFAITFADRSPTAETY